MYSLQSQDIASAAIQELREQLCEGWNVIDSHLEKEFPFRDFKEALEFTNRVGAIAEKQAHHPDILLRWGKVKLTIWTHSIDGLSQNDFILAAKADGAFER